MKKLLLCVTLSLVCPFVSRAAADNQYGLRFVSHEDIKDNRTSLALTPEAGMKLRGECSLSFDVRFRAARHTFGYVFRLVCDEDRSLNMVSEMRVGNPTVSFTGDGGTLAEFALRDSLGRPAYDRWIHVRVARDRDGITIEVDGDEKRLDMGAEYSHFRLWFGACDHPDFYTTDVPPMDLRDVRVTGDGGKGLRYWQLGRHDGDTVWDASDRHPGRATNPVWILDRSAHWRKRIATTVPEKYLAMAADGGRGVIYFAAGDHLALYDNTGGRELKITRTPNPMPFAPQSQQLIYDPVRRRLVVYDFDTHSVATLPTEGHGGRWTSGGAESFPRYWHHNAAFVSEIDAIVTFGGYGEHTYKSTMSVIGPNGEWESHELASKIPARYLAGMAVTGDGSLIVAGGYGSVSGLQSESPRNFYDIYRIDPHSGEVEPMGEILRDRGSEHFVFGRDMVTADNGKTLYALAYSDKRYASEITLVGIDLSTGVMKRYADAVAYRFSDIESFCTLVWDSVRSEFLLVAMGMDGDEGTALEIWSLEAPPLATSDTPQHHRSNAQWWLLAAVVAVGAVLAMLMMRHKVYTGSTLRAPSAPISESTDYHKTYRVEKKPSSILLLGGFQVVDRHGSDITGQFTHTVRSLLMLILLETCKNGRGISSQKLGDILWFDKDPENARNNRNVNIHKLRTLLEEVGRADISSRNSYWQLELGEDVFCDYSSLLEASREVGSGTGKGNGEELAAMVALASLGKLLPNIQTEWSDGYKAEFTTRLIEQLTRIAASEQVSDNPRMMLAIADAILVHDNLDEDAMRMKCTGLVRMGKKNQARQAYNAFVADFRKTLDSAPDFRFEDI